MNRTAPKDDNSLATVCFKDGANCTVFNNAVVIRDFSELLLDARNNKNPQN